MNFCIYLLLNIFYAFQVQVFYTLCLKRGEDWLDCLIKYMLPFKSLGSVLYIYTLTCHFIRYTLLVSGWTAFAFRTALILRGIDSARSWKHYSEILSILIWSHHAVAADLSAAHPWCESPVPPHPKGALLDWDLVTVEPIWVKWTHCHVQETSLRWFELCDMVHYPAGSNIRRWVTL